MEHDAAAGGAAELVLQVRRDPAHRRIRREVEVDRAREGCLIERRPGGRRVVHRKLAIEVAGHAGGQQIRRRRRQHRAEQRQVRQPGAIDRLGDRQAIRRTVATAGTGIEAEPCGPRRRDLVELRRVGRVPGEGEQLRTGKAMRDVDGAAGEAIEPLRIVRLDLDVYLADGGAGTPIAVERGEMDGTAVVPAVDAVWATTRRWLFRVDEPVGRQGQQGEELAVRPGQTHAQGLAVDDLDGTERIARVANAQRREEDCQGAGGCWRERTCPGCQRILCLDGGARLVLRASQMERVGPPRVAHLPVIREGRDRPLVVVESRQPLEDFAADRE